MNFTFNYQQLDSLPTNTWSVKMCKKDDRIQVFHGANVETNPSFFSEAVWNESYDLEGMSQASLFFGTGCRISGNNVIFHTSIDQSAPIYSLQRKDELMFSNSIIHLMVLGGTAPLKSYPFYTHDFVRIRRAGIHRPAGKLFHKGKGKLLLHFNTKVKVDADHHLVFSAYSAIPGFDDYTSLVETFRSQIGRIFKNASDAHRHFQYGQTVLCSSGYDSMTNSVICAGLGIKTFLSIIDSKEEVPDADSGKKGLGYLGIEAHEVDRHIHISKADPCDAEFALTAISNYPHLSGCEDLLHKRMLISGHSGGLIFDINSNLLQDDWTYWKLFNLPMTSSTEHRLRVGYIDVNPESMFVRHMSTVKKISRTEEMMPYIMNNEYDRPVCRRIIEEAGIPRGSFATRKKATGFKYFANPENMHPIATQEYQAFLHRSMQCGPIRWYSKGLYYMEKFIYEKWFRLHQQTTNDDPDRFRLVVLDGRRVNVMWTQSFLLQWSFETLKERYLETAHR